MPSDKPIGRDPLAYIAFLVLFLLFRYGTNSSSASALALAAACVVLSAYIHDTKPQLVKYVWLSYALGTVFWIYRHSHTTGEAAANVGRIILGALGGLVLLIALFSCYFPLEDKWWAWRARPHNERNT